MLLLRHIYLVGLLAAAGVGELAYLLKGLVV